MLSGVGSLTCHIIDIDVSERIEVITDDNGPKTLSVSG
jgi:hypothetical protein